MPTGDGSTGKRIAGLAGRSGAVDFDEVEARKLPLLYEAAGNFLDRGLDDNALADQWEDFEAFCRDEAAWLNDYALYAVLRREYKTGAWTEWPEPLRRRDPQALAQAGSGARARRWPSSGCCSLRLRSSGSKLRDAAAENGIRILGDVAIFVNMDSADVWVHPEIFELDEDLKPIRIAGVPPDYFSPTGQRWGNPLYRWDVLAETRVRLVDRSHSPRRRALRHRAPRSLSRLRGLLGDSRRGRDRGQRRVGEGAGAGVVSRA